MQIYEGIWRKRQFVPSWVIQCLVSGFFVFAACLILTASWEATITIAADVVEAALFHRRRLAPVAVLALAVVRAAGWLVYLVMAAVATARAVAAVLDIVLGLLMVVTALVQLFFGAKATHRQRKGLLPHQGGHAGKTGGDAEYGMNNYSQNNNNNNGGGY
ncbi:hypothetical protein PG994_015087 [Apiospora phragmitis]|uniref:Uncharacterized protein n=1 Tax=Apiospora phragmitis TaxID=2905665 RepID=A0ABR1SVG7_9PEZI